MTHSYITNWISKEEAQSKVKSLINDGTYKKGEIKLSSYRWADLKDHSKGYVARVHVVTGIHPELELGLTGKKKKAQKVEAEPVKEAEAVMETRTIKLFNAEHENGRIEKETSFKVDLTDEQVNFINDDKNCSQAFDMILSYAEDFGWVDFAEYEVA
jgi:hypothetical protein